ncbi:MAG: DUF4277 domain-containing protein [Desulfatitalea sp.]|nr:DUF4277 domain-containing protein [Desulfatitalea sp.]NNK01062.1 DUF4277 domain-containing protein [Desulfatitalea sp.]
MILAMVLNTFSGRTPLCRRTEYFEEKDTKLLLDLPVEPKRFCDCSLGHLMDKKPTAFMIELLFIFF